MFNVIYLHEISWHRETVIRVQHGIAGQWEMEGVPSAFRSYEIREAGNWKQLVRKLRARSVLQRSAQYCFSVHKLLAFAVPVCRRAKRLATRGTHWTRVK